MFQHKTLKAVCSEVYVYDEEQVPQLKPLLQSQIYCSRGQWGTDVQLHDFFVTSNIQTDDPAEADFFFVPGYAICVLEGNIYSLDEVDELYKELVGALPYFNASGGRDHIFVFGSGMAQSVFQSWEEYIPQAIVLTPETELFNDFAWVAIPPYRPFKDVVIPGSLDLIEVIKALEKSKPLRDRRYLTAFFGRADIARGPHPWVGGVDIRFFATVACSYAAVGRTWHVHCQELLALQELPGTGCSQREKASRLRLTFACQNLGATSWTVPPSGHVKASNADFDFRHFLVGGLSQWKQKTLHLRLDPSANKLVYLGGGAYCLAALDKLATTSIAGRWAADSEVIQLQSDSAASIGAKAKSEVVCLRVADGCPPEAVEGGVVTVELMPGFGLLDLYGQPGLYHVQDQSLLRSVERAKGGRYSATDLFSGRKDRVARALEALLEASDIEQSGRLQVLVNEGVSSPAEAGELLQLEIAAGAGAESNISLFALLAQMLDSRGDAFALLPMILRAQCAGGPSLSPAAAELREVLGRHSVRWQISAEDIDTSLQRGFWTLPADLSGLHLREREAERLLERARRELWTEGSASRKELEMQIRKFLCLHLVGVAACRARLRFSFARPRATPAAQEMLSAHRFSPLPAMPGLWWRLELAPLELPEL
ncbi:F8H [Symbiodinium pilosum]|uniref:F8H protein n=1 Tax=Symbiodinium pilosum TaxID=2952 RepID=A0A812IZS4_SYMPI|nr:F8H [Symbiodinium pilosum]